MMLTAAGTVQEFLKLQITWFPFNPNWNVDFNKNLMHDKSNFLRLRFLKKNASIWLIDNCWYIIDKPADASNYQNLVDILDEMAITGIQRYAIVDPTPEDEILIANNMEPWAKKTSNHWRQIIKMQSRKMNKEHRYIFEKGSKKHNCPECDKKRYVMYVDIETKEYSPEPLPLLGILRFNFLDIVLLWTPICFAIDVWVKPVCSKISIWYLWARLSCLNFCIVTRI